MEMKDRGSKLAPASHADGSEHKDEDGTNYRDKKTTTKYRKKTTTSKQHLAREGVK